MQTALGRGSGIVRPGLTSALSDVLGTPCRVRAVGEGAESVVFALLDRADVPLRIGGDELVAKVYARGIQMEAIARRQFGILERLYRVLDRRAVDEWTARVPRPVAVCERVPALLMTRVPGDPTEQLLRENRLSAAAGASLAAAISCGLNAYWRACIERYGDLNLGNILCDAEHRVASFVDPGWTTPDEPDESARTRWYPVSQDIARLLCEASAPLVKHSLTSPRAVARHHDFVCEVLRRTVVAQHATADLARFVGEVNMWAGVELDRMDTGDGFKGPWRRVVKMIAARQVAAWLSRVEGGFDRDRRVVPDVSSPERVTGDARPVA